MELENLSKMQETQTCEKQKRETEQTVQNLSNRSLQKRWQNSYHFDRSEMATKSKKFGTGYGGE